MITLGELRENGLPGKFIEVNDVGLSRLRYTREEFLELDPLDIFMEYIVDASVRIKDMIHDLLEFSRFQLLTLNLNH